MAEQSVDPLRFLTEKLFCPKCEHVFKNPKQLPCLHCVCLPCLEALQQARGRHVIIPCPCCQQESELKSGMVVDLPNSPYIASLQEMAQIMSRKMSFMKCAFCNNEPTTLQGNYCFQCHRFWCGNCVSQHNAIHNHRLVPLEDIPEAHSPLKLLPLCQIKHHEEKEVELFCTKCEIAMCHLCSSTDHENHPKKVLKASALERKSQMETLTDEQLKEAQKKMDEVRRIDEECKEVDNQATEVKNDVNNFFQTIADCLKEKKKKHPGCSAR